MKTTMIVTSALVAIAALAVAPGFAGMPNMPGMPNNAAAVKTGKGVGIITALDPGTGKVLKEGRNREALGEYYASPVAADGKIYLSNVEGKITVLKAGSDWQVLATNNLEEEVHATPALSGGRIYIRTHGQLYCFGGSR